MLIMILVMAVPAHDERDFEFATLYQLPIVQVVESSQLPFTDEGIVCNSGSFLDGLRSGDAKQKVIELLRGIGAGDGKVTYKLRDWVFSRQR